MDKYNLVVGMIESMNKELVVVHFESFYLSGADFTALFSGSDQALQPVQKGIFVPVLFGHVHFSVTIVAGRYNRIWNAAGFGSKTPVRTVGPLHRRAYAVASLEPKVIAHANFFSVAYHGHTR